MIVLFALVGCEKGPAPAGTIHGRVTQSVLGGAPDENGRGVVTVTPLECRVTVSGASGKSVGDVATNAEGVFELRVPPGHYTVSFTACGGDVCDQGSRGRGRLKSM